MQRRHERDLQDIQSFLRDGLIQIDRLPELFHLIEPQLIRYPAIDPQAFRDSVTKFSHDR